MSMINGLRFPTLPFSMSDGDNGISRTLEEHGKGTGIAAEVLEEPICMGKFKAIPYYTNYVSILTPDHYESLQKKRSNRGRYTSLLKKYYLSKKINSSVSNTTSTRSGSISSASDTSTVQNERARVSSLVDIFLDTGTDIEYFQYMTSKTRQNSISSELTEYGGSISSATGIGMESGANNLFKSQYYESSNPLAPSFLNYYERLLTVEPKETSALKRHQLWTRRELKLPGNGEGKYENEVLNQDRMGRAPRPSSPTNTNIYCDPEYAIEKHTEFDCSSTVPQIFGDFKLPALTYHCTIQMDNHIFILGGLMPCHNYTENMPSLEDFVVDEVENLPPPLLSDVVNNPSMISNPHLYTLSTTSHYLRKPELSGHIPPPLLCMKGSKLTDRYIFFYGGFEVRTETKCDAYGIYHLSKRILMNSSGYILDTVSFKFSKVELVGEPHEHVANPTISPRFGHTQISAYNEMSFNDLRSMNALHNSSNNGERENSPNPILMSRTASPRFAAVHGCTLNTVYIFGGYRQTGDDNYEAMNDMWKIEIPVLFRGKRGYYKFGDAATATLIGGDGDYENNSKWPSRRAFAAYCMPEVPLFQDDTVNELLANLAKNFKIEAPVPRDKVATKSIFPRSLWSKDSASSNSLLGRAGEVSSASSTTSESARLSSSASIPRLTQTPSFFKRNNKPKKLKNVILHGGSNNHKVYGDMWWFNVETEKWTKIETFRTNDNMEMEDKDLKLVGHSIVSVNHMLTFVGGLDQDDVNTIYLQSGNLRDNESRRLLDVLDLKTQCFVDQRLKSSMSRKNQSVQGESDQMVCIGGEVDQFNGTIILIGGLVAIGPDYSDVLLRGTILECIIPLLSLSN